MARAAEGESNYNARWREATPAGAEQGQGALVPNPQTKGPEPIPGLGAPSQAAAWGPGR